MPPGDKPHRALAPRPGHIPWGAYAAAGVFFLLIMALLAEMARERWLGASIRAADLVFMILFLALFSSVLLVVVVGAFRDQLAAAERSRARLQRLADSNLVGVAILDRRGRVVEANNEFLRIIGEPPGSTPTRTTFWGGPTAEAEAHAIHEARRRGASPPKETVFQRADGLEVPVVAGLAALPPPGEEFVAAVLDISEQKQAERALARHAEELSHSNEELERFAYVASHDLQEPLRMVTSYVQLLQRRYHGRLDEDADEFIRFAVEGARRMQDLIQDLLSYSRIGNKRPPMGTTSTEEAFRRALNNLAGLAAEREAEITHDPLPEVRGHPQQLTQLFQNLLSNAVKFVPDDRRPRVHVAAEPFEGAWRFSIADNGIGIPPEYQDRVFVIFQRLHDRESYPGTGIGLAICKKIVEQHGGRIWFESKPGEGTTFYFTLDETEATTSEPSVEPEPAEEAEAPLETRARKLI